MAALGGYADIRNAPHAQAIGFASHRLGHNGPGRWTPVQEYTRKARVSWDHPCELPGPGKERGVWTGARRAPYPKIHRPYGTNTKQHVVGNRKFTGMTHYGYDADIVQSKPVEPLVPVGSHLAQEGAPEILRHVPSLRPGSGHYLFETPRG